MPGASRISEWSVGLGTKIKMNQMPANNWLLISYACKIVDHATLNDINSANVSYRARKLQLTVNAELVLMTFSIIDCAPATWEGTMLEFKLRRPCGIQCYRLLFHLVQ